MRKHEIDEQIRELLEQRRVIIGEEYRDKCKACVGEYYRYVYESEGVDASYVEYEYVEKMMDIITDGHPCKLIGKRFTIYTNGDIFFSNPGVPCDIKDIPQEYDRITRDEFMSEFATVLRNISSMMEK